MHHSGVYFDYNSSAPLSLGAKQAYLDTINIYGNPSSVHGHGRQMRRLIEDARAALAERLKITSPDALIFNSGCTEGNNTVLKTFEALGAKIFVSAAEHACVLRATQDPAVIPVDQNGIIDLMHLEQKLKDFRRLSPNGIGLVSVMVANNELGTISPLKEVIQLARHYGMYVHTDAAQALGRIPIDIDAYPVDYLTVSSQKIGGPIGVGALYIKPDAPYAPLILGASQEKNRRAGTLNGRSIHAFHAALTDNIPTNWGRACQIRNWIEETLLATCPGAKIWAREVDRIPNTTSILMPGVDGQTQVMAFDLAGYSVSTGSACSSGTVSVSHVLRAIGLSEKEASQTIRVSLCPDVTHDQATGFVTAWKNLYQRAATDETECIKNNRDQSIQTPFNEVPNQPLLRQAMTVQQKMPTREL